MIPLPPLPPAPARRDPCHSADAAILLLRLQPTQNAPSPREPLLHGAQHSGKELSGASPGGSAARRAEPDPRKSRLTLRASPRHRPTAHAYGRPPDCAGPPRPLLTPAPGSFSLPVVGCFTLATCLLLTSDTPGLWKAGRRQACRAVREESPSFFWWNVSFRSWVLTFALCLRRF